MPDSEPRTPLLQSYFVITGVGFVPEEATAAIGITPTSSRSDTKLVGTSADGEPWYRHPEWILECERLPGVDTNREFLVLLAMVWPRRKEIVEFLRRPGLEASFGTTIRHFGQTPQIWLSPETLEKLSFFQVDYVVDIYDLS